MTIKTHDILWQKWGAITWLAAILLGVGIFSYRAVERNQSDIQELSDVELPLFQDIQELRTALVSIESTVYEYYLTTDQAHFEQRYGLVSEQVQLSLQSLNRTLGDRSELNALTTLSGDMHKTVFAFSSVMASSPIDWDLAREKLALFGPYSVLANEESRALGVWVRARVLDISKSHAQRLQQTVYLVVFLTFLAVIAAAWLAKTNSSRMRALREQERLASFPRSNPHPVLALDRYGKVIYSNDAASILSSGADLECLLPDDIFSYLTEFEHYREWEFSKEGRHLQFSLGWLPEYQEYHAYISDITARKKAEEDLEYLAYHDPTTGLINRQQFNEFVDSYLDEAGEQNLLLVAIMDMDLLDTVVAIAGVSAAEKVARVASIRLQHAVTEESYFKQSCLSYIGGGLFCFAYPNDKVEADLIFHRMQESISRPFDIDGFEFYLELNIGVVGAEHLNDSTCEEALRLADGALNLAKKRGGNQIVVYESGIEEQRQYRMQIELGLRHAIENQEFELFYQPKIEIESGTIKGVEALIRWKHATLGYVSPDSFVPIAEDSGLILDIGQWVIDKACEDLEYWNRGQAQHVGVAINISAKQLLHTDLAQSVMAALKRNDVPVSWLELEITETAALTDFERALERLNALSEVGIRLSLDDFGTGYSSLSYLQRLPVNTLKIDRSFVNRISSDEKDASLAETMIKMAHQLNLDVVAEGVETQQQLKLLTAWGCEYIQGYIFAQPMRLQDFMAFKKAFKIAS